MNFFKNIFSSKSVETADPNIKFGRYSDSYKSEEKYDHWDKSVEHFENKEYFACYQLFFDYLKDDKSDNVHITDDGEKLEFVIYQGSKKITGYTSKDKIFAESKIAKTNSLHIGFLRKLVEMNFNLRYCRFALDPDRNITMVFNSYYLDTSPYKLYYALKELSTFSDKQDDILLKEFQELEKINTGHTREISAKEKASKYKFLIEKCNEAITEYNTGKLNKVNYPGGISYFLLSIVYKLDYLLKPEGNTMSAFEQIHQNFFSNNGVSAHKKNEQIIKSIIKIHKTTEEDFNSEIYEVLSTFGVTSPTSYQQYTTFLEGEIINMDWYVDNKYKKIAVAIPDYIVGFSLFNYALPAPLKHLLHFFYEIKEEQFFKDLEFDSSYRTPDGFNAKAIRKKLSWIMKNYHSDFPMFYPNSKTLDFSNEINFWKSYLLMTKNLDLRKRIK